MTAQEFQAPLLTELAPLFPKYRMEAFIAQGGMGAVYLATQISLERPIAIKILPRELGKDESFRRSFIAEAKAMAKLNHPKLVGVYDFGEVDGMPFIAMEYVAGKSLHDSAHGKKIDPLEAARITLETLQGLQHAHEQGVLHRDVKPLNILLQPPRAEVKLGDFGLAISVGEGCEEGTIYGTPGYAAPEVYEGRPDARSDVYAAAVIFYELLTGQLPGVPYQHPTALAQCDCRFDSLLAKALQPEPNRRYQSAVELAEAIEAVLKKSAVVAPVAVVSPRSLSALPLRSKKKSSAGVVMGSIAALLTIGGMAFFLLQKSPADKPLATILPSSVPVAREVVVPEKKEVMVIREKQSSASQKSLRKRQREAQVKAQEEIAILDEQMKRPRNRGKDREPVKEGSLARGRQFVEEKEEDEGKLLPMAQAPQPAFDHHAFLKRGRAYCVQNTQLLVAEYQEELLKNVVALEREGRAILRDEEKLDRETESMRKGGLELVIQEFEEKGRLPEGLALEIPAAFRALTKKQGVVEQVLLEALEKQQQIDDELAGDLKPIASQYVAGLRKEVVRLEQEEQTLDAQILRNEVTEVESGAHYFTAIVIGDFPLPAGLEADPELTSLKYRMIGRWQAERNKAELVIALDGRVKLLEPARDGSLVFEEDEVLLVWEDRKDVLSFVDEGDLGFSVYNPKKKTTTRYHRLPETASRGEGGVADLLIVNRD